MIVTIRLDSDLKNQINKIASLYTPPKKFSDMMRVLLEKGINQLTKEESDRKEASVGLDIRYMAQRYDFQEKLTIKELQALFQLLNSILYSQSEHFELHPSDLKELVNMFLDVISSNVVRPEAWQIFRDHTVIEHFRADAEINHKSLKSFKDYLEETASFLRQQLEKWQEKPILKENHPVFPRHYILTAIAQIMFEITEADPQYIFNWDEFQKIIYPYLKTIITITKTRVAKEQGVCHFLSNELFLKKQGIKDTYRFYAHPPSENLPGQFSTQYAMNFPCSRDEFSFSSCLSFGNKKDFLMMLNFQEFIDMLRFASLLHKHIDSIVGAFWLNGVHLSLTLFHSDHNENSTDKSSSRGWITIREQPVYFSTEEFVELFSLFEQIAKEMEPQIQELKYQLGGI